VYFVFLCNGEAEMSQGLGKKLQVINCWISVTKYLQKKVYRKIFQQAVDADRIKQTVEEGRRRRFGVTSQKML